MLTPEPVESNRAMDESRNNGTGDSSLKEMPQEGSDNTEVDQQPVTDKPAETAKTEETDKIKENKP